MEVKDCVFQEGRKVSVNLVARILKLTDKRSLEDGSVLEKIENFSKQGVERDIFKMVRR